MKIGSKEWAQVIVEGAKAFDLERGARHTDLFAAHAEALLWWNRKSNITAITDPLEVAVKHFLDSLAAAALISPGTAALLDIGSGGGFPGIVLKIVRPRLAVTLIDAARKKVSFLRHVIRILELQDIEALHVRAENLAADQRHCRRFDVIVSRALSSLPAFVDLARPLLSGNGCMLAMKGRPDCFSMGELDRAGSEEGSLEARGLVISRHAYCLPVLQMPRWIIRLQVQQRI